MKFVEKIFSTITFALCRPPIKEACAEFLGTLFLVVCGNGVMALITFNRMGQSGPVVAAFGWGLALMVGVSISGGVSGGHLNPAVTTALAVVRKCPLIRILPYVIAQYLASFIAAAVVYCVYSDALNEFDNGFRQLPPSVNSTADIFSTYPGEFVSIGSCFLDQVVGTALFLIVICAVTDKRNMRLSLNWQPAVIGLGLTAICLAFGHNCGAALNPARDLGPRIFTALAGWGTEVFSFRQYMWFWIPVIGPHVGGVLGAWMYDFFIEMPSRNYILLLEESGSDLDEEERIQTLSASQFPVHQSVIDEESLSSEYTTGKPSEDGTVSEDEKSGELSQKLSRSDVPAEML